MTEQLDDIHFVTGCNYLYCHDNSIINPVGTSINDKMCFHFISLVDMNIHHTVIDVSLSSYPLTSYKGTSSLSISKST